MSSNSTIVSAIDYEDARENYLGFCSECQSFTTECCEPDAEDYECEECGIKAVVGAENALIEGLIEIGDSE